MDAPDTPRRGDVTVTDRNLALELVRVTEAAAVAASRWIGLGKKNDADGAAVEAMRKAFDTIDIDGTVVIGEGEMDEAPMLYIGEKVGAGGPAMDIAVDPLESRRKVAEGFGATTVDPGGVEDVVARVKELTGGGATYAIDTTAISAVVKQAQQSLAIRGTLVALGLGAEEYAVDAIDLLQGGKTVLASIEGDSDPQEIIPRLVEMRAAGSFALEPRLTSRRRNALRCGFGDRTLLAVRPRAPPSARRGGSGPPRSIQTAP